MFSGPHRCDHCGDETVYGNHKACRLGSPQDQEEARRAMKGSPETVYSIAGKTVTKEEWDAHLKGKTLCPECKQAVPALCWDDGDIMCVNCKERKHR